MNSVIMLPAMAGTCPDCAHPHAPEQPHNLQSLFYLTQFNARVGRPPTWHDAMRHCCEDVKTYWLTALAGRGVVLGEDLHAGEAMPEPLKAGAPIPGIGTVEVFQMEDDGDDDEEDDEICPDCERQMTPKKSWGGELACYCLWGGRCPSAAQLDKMSSTPGIYESKRVAVREKLSLPLP